MTAKELNRDIKRLGEMEKKFQKLPDKAYFEAIQNEFKPEFTRLYHASKGFEYMNLNSIKILLRLNVKHNVIAKHVFGIGIEL